MPPPLPVPPSIKDIIPTLKLKASAVSTYCVLIGIELRYRHLHEGIQMAIKQVTKQETTITLSANELLVILPY